LTKYAKSYIGKRTKKLIEQLNEANIKINIEWNLEANKVVVYPITKRNKNWEGLHSKGILKKNGINTRTAEILSVQLTQIVRKYSIIIKDLNWLQEKLIVDDNEKQKLKTALMEYDSIRNKRGMGWEQ
jgi:hypothetical protein